MCLYFANATVKLGKIAIERLVFFDGTVNVNVCDAVALRDGEKSLKCIGFLDGKGVVSLIC